MSIKYKRGDKVKVRFKRVVDSGYEIPYTQIVWLESEYIGHIAGSSEIVVRVIDLRGGHSFMLVAEIDVGDLTDRDTWRVETLQEAI